MRASVDYAAVKEFTASLAVEDIGNTCIRGKSLDLGESYLFIRTVAGQTTTLAVGPFLPGIPVFCKDFSVTTQCFKYNENRIIKAIKIFLNSFGKIEFAEEISTEEGIENFPDIVAMFEALKD